MPTLQARAQDLGRFDTRRQTDRRMRETAESSLTAVMGRVALTSGSKGKLDFMTEKINRSICSRKISIWNGNPAAAHAFPGQYKLS